MSFKLGDSLGERRRLVFCLELRELFLELGHLSLKHVELLVLLFGLRYFSSLLLSLGVLATALRQGLGRAVGSQ